MSSTQNVYDRIKRRPIYKHHIPNKALVPKADVHVNLGVYRFTNLYDAYAILIYNLAVLLGRRGDEARKLTTKSICYEKNRKLGGFNRPRISFNLLSNKEDPEGELRIRSMNSTRECVMECYTCREDHDENNPMCPISSFDKV